eukprot:5230033-Amphidinium_carterae.1
MIRAFLRRVPLAAEAHSDWRVMIRKSSLAFELETNQCNIVVVGVGREGVLGVVICGSALFSGVLGDQSSTLFADKMLNRGSRCSGLVRTCA